MKQHVKQMSFQSDIVEEANPKVVPVGVEWQIIDHYHRALTEDKLKREKEIIKVKKSSFKEALDLQIKAAKELKEKQEVEARKFNEIVERDLKLHQEQELQKRMAIRQKHEDELAIRKKQIEEQISRREQEKLLLRKAEEDALLLATKKLQMEREAFQEAKSKEMSIRHQIELTNEANKEKKKFCRLKEAEEDTKLMEMYAARLDKEAVDRETAFKRRMDGMDSVINRFATDGAGKIAQEERLKMDQYLVQELLKKEAQDNANDLKKEEERKKRLEITMRENEKLLDWRRRIEELERKESEELAKKFKEDSNNYLQGQQENRRMKKAMQNQYRQLLTSQMNEKEHSHHGHGRTAAGDAAMEARERAMNMDVLKKAVEEVPQILKKIQRPKTAVDRRLTHL
jgi:hypothetical protein